MASRAPQAPALRMSVQPRDIPARAAARLLGLTVADFASKLPQLAARGFPCPDETTGNYDRKAVEAWMDRRSRLTADAAPTDAAARVARRLEAFGGGRT